jgi:molecular chaperone HscC
MPLVSRLVARILGRLPLRHVNPDQAIGLGAAVAAGMKARDHSLEEIVLTDVSPYTLGIATSRMDEQGRRSDGHFSPLIERNSTVPVSRSETYRPVQDMQTELRLEVFQGESPRVVNNVRLGELNIGLPKLPAKDNAVDVRFTYDINGVLQVEVLVVATGRKHELILEKNPGTLSSEEISRRFAALAELKVHPREAQANVAVVARAERIYEEHLGDVRKQVQDWLTRFLGVLDTQDTALIDRHRQQFSAALDELEQRVR